MKRRSALLTLAGLPAAGMTLPGRAESRDAGEDLDDPYAEVDWDRCAFLHSMSHQHQGQSDRSRDLFREMGYRHFAFSNYYPSAPTPLPEEYAAAHPGLIGSPNAEHHSFLDSSLHSNALGSLLATGYGSSVGSDEWNAIPLVHRFEGLRPFDEARPWLGVYRLDLRLELVKDGTEDTATAALTVEGATECVFRDHFPDRGAVRERPLAAGNHTIYLRAGSPSIGIRLDYDRAKLSMAQCRLMQGSNRPWRDVFLAALDGETADGRREGGLAFADGGGITLNHPTGALDQYAEMLDFDPRVLGIEVWNQLTSGFGTAGGFYAQGPGPSLHFYRLWDDLLRTGRRCWGFFVKDHNTYGRGRNVLLVPAPDGLPTTEQEAAALRAYRRGAFFGSVAALATNESGEVVPPYDRSDFRFSRLVVRRDAEGRPVAIEAAVAGNDPDKRPQIQIRFVTDEGVAAVVDGPQAKFPLKRDGKGRLAPAFVRVEAFAYPRTHRRGEPLTAETVRGLNVHDISLLHDHMAQRGPNFFGGPQELRAPVPIVDMIFSQPFRRV